MIDMETLDMTERTVLFAALRDDNVRATLLARASEDWFFAINHRRLFSAMATMAKRDIPVDTPGVLRAARVNENANVGDVVLDPEWLNAAQAELGTGMSVEGLVESHMPILREAYQARTVQQFFLRGVDKSADSDPSQLLNWAMTELEKISSASSEKAESKSDHAIVADSMFEDDDDEADEGGPLTKLPELDQIDFRLTPGQLITIAGRPGECKTLLATQIALGASTQCPVLVFALEDGFEGWQKRRLTMIARQSGDVFQRPEIDTGYAFERRSEYVGVAKDRPLFVVSGREQLSAFDIVAKMREFKLKYSDLGVVIIDQTYDIADYADTKKGEALTYSIFRLLQKLKAAAVSLKISVIVLQHVKDVTGRPGKNDIADSQYFYKMSRKVIITSHATPDREGDDPAALLDVVKFTHGKPRPIPVSFNGAQQRLGKFVDPLYRSSY